MVMKRVDSCAPYGLGLHLKDSQVEGPARIEQRERVKQLHCKDIDVRFQVHGKLDLFWTTQSPYYGKVEIPATLLSWIDYLRPETMLPEDCVNITMTYFDPSNTVTRTQRFYITVDFDEFMALCGDLICPSNRSDIEDRRRRIKETGQWPNVM